jgi:hypothetical protein
MHDDGGSWNRWRLRAEPVAFYGTDGVARAPRLTAGGIDSRAPAPAQYRRKLERKCGVGCAPISASVADTLISQIAPSVNTNQALISIQSLAAANCNR